MAEKGDFETTINATNKGAMPQVPKEYWEPLRKVAEIDTTGFVDKIKEKKIKEWILDLLSISKSMPCSEKENGCITQEDRIRSHRRNKI